MVSESKRAESKEKFAVSSWLIEDNDDFSTKPLHQAQVRGETAQQDSEPRRTTTHGRKLQSGEGRARAAIAITRTNKPRIRVAPLKRISAQESNPSIHIERENGNPTNFIKKDSDMAGQLSAESFVYNDSNIDAISTHSSITNSWAPRIRLFYPPASMQHKPIENMVITVQKPEIECESTRMDDLQPSRVMLRTTNSDVGRVSQPRPKLNQLHGLEDTDEDLFDSSFLSLALTEEQRAEVEQFVFRAWSSDDDCDDSKASHISGKRKSLPSNSNDDNFRVREQNESSDVSRNDRSENREKISSLPRFLREKSRTVETKEKPCNNYLPGWIFCDPAQSQKLNFNQKDNEIDIQFPLPFLVTDDIDEKKQVSFYEERTKHETDKTQKQENVDFKNPHNTALKPRLENVKCHEEILKNKSMQKLNDEIEEGKAINQEKYIKLHDRLKVFKDSSSPQAGTPIVSSTTCHTSLLFTSAEKNSIDEPNTRMTEASSSSKGIHNIHQCEIKNTNDSPCLPLISSIESKVSITSRFSTPEVKTSTTEICEDLVYGSKMRTTKQCDMVESLTEVASMTSQSNGETSSFHDIDVKANLTWREIQSEVDAVIRRFHSTIATLDNDFDFEDDFDIFPQHSLYVRERFDPLRCAMLKDGTLTEKEVAAFFSGLSLQSVKVRSLECQVESLKVVTNTQLECHTFSCLRSFLQRNYEKSYEASNYTGSTDFFPTQSYDSATNALLEELESIESKRLELEKKIMKRFTHIHDTSLFQESQVFKPVSQHLREDDVPEEVVRTITPDNLAQSDGNMYEQAFKSNELNVYQDKNPSFTLAAIPGSGDASLVDVGIDQSIAGKSGVQSDKIVTQKELEKAQHSCFLYKEHGKIEDDTNILCLLHERCDAIYRIHPTILENLQSDDLTITELSLLCFHLERVGIRWQAEAHKPEFLRKWLWFNKLKTRLRNAGNLEDSLIGRNELMETSIESGTLKPPTSFPFGNDIQLTDGISIDLDLKAKQKNLESTEKTLCLSQGKPKTNGHCSLMDKTESEFICYKHNSRSNALSKKNGRINVVTPEAGIKLSGKNLDLLGHAKVLGGEENAITPESIEGGDCRIQQTLHLGLDFTKPEDMKSTTKRIVSGIVKAPVNDQKALKQRPVSMALHSKVDSSSENSSSTIEQSHLITESKFQLIHGASPSGTPTFTNQIVLDVNDSKGVNFVCPTVPDECMTSGVVDSSRSQIKITALRRNGINRHVSSTLGRSENTSRRTKSSACLITSQSREVEVKDESRSKIQDSCLAIENKTVQSIEMMSSLGKSDLKINLLDKMEREKDSRELRLTRVETSRKSLKVDSRTNRPKKLEPDVAVEVFKPDLVKNALKVLASEPSPVMMKQLVLTESKLNGKHTRESQLLTNTNSGKEKKGGKMNPNKRNFVSEDRSLDRPRSNSRRNSRLS